MADRIPKSVYEVQAELAGTCCFVHCILAKAPSRHQQTLLMTTIISWLNTARTVAVRGVTDNDGAELRLVHP